MSNQYEDEEQEEENEPDSYRRLAIIAGVAVAVLCIGLLIILFLGRQVFLAPIMQMFASETPVPTATLPPTATYTALPTETPTVEPTQIEIALPTVARDPAPEVLALSQGTPLFEEKFLDNANLWAGMDVNSEFTIQEGQLILRSAQPNQPAIAYCGGNCGPFKVSYYYQADLTPDRTSTAGYGLVFGMNAQKDAYYAFMIRPDSGQYSLFKLVSGAWTPLIDWTPTPAIMPYPQPNVLGVQFQEKSIDLYINRTRVGSQADKNPILEGRVGVAVNQSGVRVSTTNLLVLGLLPTTPTPTGQQPPQGITLTPGIPTPVPGKTYTPTAKGACPSYIPAGSWVLIVTKVNPGKGSITINGSKSPVVLGLNQFYLPLNTAISVTAGGKSYDYRMAACKIVYIKMK